MHQAKSAPTVTRVAGPEYSFSLEDAVTSTVTQITGPARKSFIDTNRSSRAYSYTEQHGSDTNSDYNEEGISDEDSPTIRKAILSSTMNLRESGISRDSMATIKADSYGSESISHGSSPFSLSPYQLDHREDPPIPFRPLLKDGETRPSLSSLQEDARDDFLSQDYIPPSTTSTTAQEVEVPSFSGLSQTIPTFALVRSPLPVKIASHLTLISQADSSSSSLLTNRLAKSRGPALSSPPTVTAIGKPSALVSAGSLFTSYHQDDPLTLNSPPIQDTDVGPAEAAASPEHVSPMPHMMPKTPTWLKPLRLVGVTSSLMLS